jgi:hypothetical protein
VTVYRLHDIGYAIALDHAAELLGALLVSLDVARVSNRLRPWFIRDLRP